MLRTLKRFAFEEGAPRWKEIVFSSTPWLASAVGFVVSKHLINSADSISAHNFANASLTYSSIAFGFCVTAVTMCLAISDGVFVRKLVARKRKESCKHGAFSDLIFIFTWTAFMHIVLVATSLIALFRYKSTDPLFHPACRWWETGAAGAFVALQVYALMQFLTTVLTLSSVAKVYINHVESMPEEASPKKPSRR